ncbi:hypothetical protein D3C84_621210 [compost metagenome]
MGTPDHLRDECAAALGAEANRQAKAMGLFMGDVTPHILGMLERIRNQEQVAQARADLDAAVAALVVMPAICSPAIGHAVRCLLGTLGAFTDALQAASNHTANQCHACCQCKASALGAGSHVQAGG